MSSIFNLEGEVFFKFNAVADTKVQIVLWDYRHAHPLQVGMIMDLEGDDFDPHTLEYILAALTVNMANHVMSIASTN